MGGDGGIVGALAADSGAKQQCYIAELRTLSDHGTQASIVGEGLTHTLWRNGGQENAVCVTGVITHTLTAEGFDASEEYPSGVGAVSGVFGLPVPRHEIFDAIDLVIRQALEDPCEPRFGVDVVQLACLHECVGDCGSFAATD